MERIFYQAEGGTAEGLERVSEQHGTKVSVCRRKRETEQVEPRGIGRGLPGQSVPAAAQQVLNRFANGFHPRGKLHRDHFREQVRLRLGRCGNQAGVASYLYVPGKQIARAK